MPALRISRLFESGRCPVLLQDPESASKVLALLKKMKPVYTYKGISNRLFVFGLQPVDIFLALVGFLFVHGFLNSLTLDLCYLALALLLARKFRDRPSGYFLSLLLMFVTPFFLPVPERGEETKK